MLAGMVRFASLVAAFIALAAGADRAHAETTSGTMQVSLTIRAACAVAAQPMTFSGKAGTAIQSQADIAVTCSVDTPVSVTLDAGSNAVGSQRYLAGTGGTVAYDLYRDAARTQTWSPGSAREAMVAGGAPLQMTAYGAIDPSQSELASGGYNDSLVVRVDF